MTPPSATVVLNGYTRALIRAASSLTPTGHIPGLRSLIPPDQGKPLTTRSAGVSAGPP